MTEVVRQPTTTWISRNVIKIVWAGLDGDDSGAAVDLSGFPDKTVEVSGVFNGATATLYGCTDPAAVTDRTAGTLFSAATAPWVANNDVQGNVIAKTVLAHSVVLENDQFNLPVVTGGGGSTNLTFTVIAKRSRP